MCSLRYHLPYVKVMHLWKENSDTNVPRLAIATHGGSNPRVWAYSGAAGLGTSLQEGEKIFPSYPLSGKSAVIRGDLHGLSVLVD